MHTLPRLCLLLVYWSGADALYVDGAGFNLYPLGRQGILFSLMKALDDHFQLMPLAMVLLIFGASTPLPAIALTSTR